MLDLLSQTSTLSCCVVVFSFLIASDDCVYLVSLGLSYGESDLLEISIASHVSDMLAVVRFLFGEPDSKTEGKQDDEAIENREQFFHSQIGKCRADLMTSALKLKEFSKQVGRVIKIGEDNLPYTTFEKLIEATVGCRLSFESVHEFWELISKNELDKFTTLLKSHYDLHKSRIRETLKDVNPKAVCKRCRECLNLPVNKVR
ncbi:unnamed protein product [Rodentolepis nana]|uniref:Uncharacterized protein n=1 Tax=Rodentolepis nana TaxID=102285 RepID=A0A0R3TDT3_RODNA|nr:unnamed protein product [Rodentolepis nana]